MQQKSKSYGKFLSKMNRNLLKILQLNFLIFMRVYSAVCKIKDNVSKKKAPSAHNFEQR
jgi:hypothetical protein